MEKMDKKMEHWLIWGFRRIVSKVLKNLEQDFGVCFTVTSESLVETRERHINPTKGRNPHSN